VLRIDLGKNDNHHPARKGNGTSEQHFLTYLLFTSFNFDPITCTNADTIKVVHISARRSGITRRSAAKISAVRAKPPRLDTLSTSVAHTISSCFFAQQSFLSASLATLPVPRLAHPAELSSAGSPQHRCPARPEDSNLSVLQSGCPPSRVFPTLRTELICLFCSQDVLHLACSRH
jgi:hypothetical protein